MKILLFEWLSSGGLYHDGDPTDDQSVFQQQGQAMLEALAEDLDLAGYQLHIPVDDRLCLSLPPATKLDHVSHTVHLQSVLKDLANSCDGILLIAPECDGCLETCCHWLEQTSHKLLSPDAAFVRLTSCKQKTAQALADAGVTVPFGKVLTTPDDLSAFDFPLVIKPLTGAGSGGVCYFDHPEELTGNEYFSAGGRSQYRVESFMSGIAVSVSVLNGPLTKTFLPATGQQFDQHPIGVHTGSTWPLPPEIADRARSLAMKAMAAMPETSGYVGVDIVIADSGPQADAVIEINPRLTTSYLKLREILPYNVGQKMVKIATGQPDTVADF